MRSLIAFAIMASSGTMALAGDIKLTSKRMIDVDPPGLKVFHASRQNHDRALSSANLDTADRFRREIVRVPRSGGVWSILMPVRLPSAEAFDEQSKLIGDRQDP
ncbi:hypothetical protein [Aureimonas sp. AU4]|uniref:hypothetical protein n=1 Tax=Aureimonas sp. AU4 TaxID=1638163 RepID=UPI000ADC9E51|nr:hypothetical protein [Aureimonas sp. AU4]